jgi:hypothetical protein
MNIPGVVLAVSLIALSGMAAAQNCPYDPRCLNSPITNPYAPSSATTPYAAQAPRLYDWQGNYRGQLSINPYAPDSTSNPYGQYGSPYSPDSLNNPYGPGNPYNRGPIYVVPRLGF